MNNFCKNCGTQIIESYKVCPNCGISLNINNNVSLNIKNRNIGICILLSLLTCGIYIIYWFIKITDESNQVSGDNTTSGGMALLFSLLTCGFYTYYWSYKMGQKMNEAGKRYGKNIEDNSILYLVLSLLGFGFINYFIIQNDLNKFSE